MRMWVGMVMMVMVMVMVTGTGVWVGVGMEMEMGIGGGMTRVVVRCRVPGFRDGGPPSLRQRRGVFAGSGHGWCFMGLGLD